MKNAHIFLGLILATIIMGCSKQNNSTLPESLLGNEPPLSFNLIDVVDNATNVDVLPTLSWESAKNPEGSEVTYDLYLGKETNPTTVYKSDISETSFQIEERLNLISDYYWKVVAKDVDGQVTQSSINKFTTRNLNVPDNPLLANAPFEDRWNHNAIIFNDKIWIIGGRTSKVENDVWYSIDGVKWIEATSAAQFPPRTEYATVVFDNKMWVIGGIALGGIGRKNDVWYSSDGINWTEATENASFSARNGHIATVFDDKIWIIGGFDGDTKNDVWHSSDGVNWIEATASAPFPSRGFSASLTFNDKIWIIGGYGGERIGDVWYSNDGHTWTEATSLAAFNVRNHHSATVFDNKMWVIGGSSNGHKNDVWYSNDGKTWFEATNMAGFSPRSRHTATTFKDKIVIIGGVDIDNFRHNDVWILD